MIFWFGVGVVLSILILPFSVVVAGQFFMGWLAGMFVAWTVGGDK